MNKPFKFYMLDVQEHKIQAVEGFKFNSSSWLARLLWKVLNKLNAIQPNEVSHKVYDFGQKQFDELGKNIQHMIEDISPSNLNNLVLIAGEDIFYDLLHGPEMLSFSRLRRFETVTYHAVTAKKGSYYNPSSVVTEIHGIPVHFCPGVSGMALVPKILLEVKND